MNLRNAIGWAAHANQAAAAFSESFYLLLKETALLPLRRHSIFLQSGITHPKRCCAPGQSPHPDGTENENALSEAGRMHVIVMHGMPILINLSLGGK
jgi:hypothetical protein